MYKLIPKTTTMETMQRDTLKNPVSKSGKILKKYIFNNPQECKKKKQEQETEQTCRK